MQNHLQDRLQNHLRIMTLTTSNVHGNHISNDLLTTWLLYYKNMNNVSLINE